MEVLNVAQASEILQVSRAVLYHLLSNRLIPHARVKGQYRIIKQDLFEWMRSQYINDAGAPFHKEGTCLIAELDQKSGGSLSAEYANLLAPMTSKQQKHLKQN